MTGDWPCDAYGPDPEVRAAGALCFFADTGKRLCASPEECREKMTAERQRVWQRRRRRTIYKRKWGNAGRLASCTGVERCNSANAPGI